MKITTLVPAYKPKYLVELLLALRHQTVKPERVIFSDDSPGHAFKAALQSEPVKSAVADLNIEVIDGPRAGAYANFRHLLHAWKSATPLVHFLLDDDIIYPDFYERHRQVHATGAFDCSVSKRWTAIESGQPAGSLPAPEPVAQHPQRVLSIDADVAFTTTVPRCNNWFGEFSNAVFGAELFDVIDDPRLGEVSFSGLEDIGTVLCASLKRPVCYLNEPLGFFRMNPEQNTQQLLGRQMKLAHLAWFALALAGRQVGKLTREQAAECMARMGQGVLMRYGQEDDMAPFRELVPGLMQGQGVAEERFIGAWNAYLAVKR